MTLNKNYKRTLIVVLGIFALVFVVGTTVSLAKKYGAEAKRSRAAASQPAWESPRAGTENYSKLGKLRLTVKGKDPILVSVSPVLAIPKGDQAFREEIIAKTKRLRDVCKDYFSSLDVDDLNPSFEGKLKLGLRDRLNQELVLGKIYEIYFPDYQIFE
jgi:flagellar basal body-associated protein FliL